MKYYTGWGDREPNCVRTIINNSAEKQLIAWGCCYRHNDPKDKILRNVQPTMMVVRIEDRGRAYYNHESLIAYPCDSSGRVTGKKMPIYSNNSHGDIELFDAYDECALYYNEMLQRDLVKVDAAITSLNKMRERIGACSIPGFIAAS